MLNLNPESADDCFLQGILHIARMIAADEQHSMVVMLRQGAPVTGNDPPEGIWAVLRPPPGSWSAQDFTGLTREVVKRIGADGVIFISEVFMATIPYPEGMPLNLTPEDLEEIREKHMHARREALLVHVEVAGQPLRVFMADIGVENGEGQRRIGPWRSSGDGLTMTVGPMADMLGETVGGPVV